MTTDKILNKGHAHLEERTDGTTVLHVAGDIDATVVESGPVLRGLTELPPRRLHVDASHVTFIDSTGLKAILRVARAVRQDGGTVSTEGSEPLRRLVWLCGVGQLLGLDPAATPA